MLGPLPVKPCEFPVPAERTVGGMFEALNQRISNLGQQPHPQLYAPFQHYISRTSAISPPPDHLPTEFTSKERRAPFYWSRSLAVNIATWLSDPRVQVRQIRLEFLSLRRAPDTVVSGAEGGERFHEFRVAECAKLKFTRLEFPIPAEGAQRTQDRLPEMIDWLVLEVRFHALVAGQGHPPNTVAEFDSETENESELPHRSREETPKRRGESRSSVDDEPFLLIALPTQAVTGTKVSALNVRPQPSPSPSLARRMQPREVFKQVWSVVISLGQRGRVPLLHTHGLDPGFAAGWMMAFAQGEALIEVGSQDDIRDIFH